MQETTHMDPRESEMASQAYLLQLKATFEQLHNVVISHFGYEETELREALGRFVPVM